MRIFFNLGGFLNSPKSNPKSQFQNYKFQPKGDFLCNCLLKKSESFFDDSGSLNNYPKSITKPVLLNGDDHSSLKVSAVWSLKIWKLELVWKLRFGNWILAKIHSPMPYSTISRPSAPLLPSASQPNDILN